MITSILIKSKPINFIIVLCITLVAFYSSGYSKGSSSLSFYFSSQSILSFFVCCASILLLNFIVSKNNLSKTSKFEIVLYGLFLLAFFQVTSNVNIILSNFFVLLSLRRILSVKSQLELSKKFFDAAFWITLAGLFYFWSILFFLLILVSLFLFANKKLRYWVIPFLGMATVLIIAVSASILIHGSYFGFFTSLPEISFNYSPYLNSGYLLMSVTLFVFGSWSALFYLKKIKQKGKTFRASFNIIFLAAIIAFLIIVFAPNKDGSEFVFLFVPLSIIISNYIEIIEKKTAQDVFLLILILVPILALVLQLNSSSF